MKDFTDALVQMRRVVIDAFPPNKTLGRCGHECRPGKNRMEVRLVTERPVIKQIKSIFVTSV